MREHRILVAEDQPTQAMKLSGLLSGAGYDVDVASNGLEALSQVQKWHPDAIVADIEMPELDGYGLCRAIRDDAELCHTVVILLTSHSAPDDVIKGLEAGADTFIAKPYDSANLLRVVAALVKRDAGDADARTLPVMFRGQRYDVRSSRAQILNFFLEAYHDTLKRQEEIKEAHQRLEEYNRNLARLVEERTAALRNSMQHQALLLRSVPVVFYKTDVSENLRTSWISEQVEAITGFPPEAFTTSTTFWQSGVHPDDAVKVIEGYSRTLSEGGCSLEYRWQCADGSYRWFLDQTVLIRNTQGEPVEAVGVWCDITERMRAEEQLRASLREKDVLLKEIHNRVKNNMQLVTSLLNLQSSRLHDPRDRALFHDSQLRIRSMALVQDNLYHSSNLAFINFGEYTRQLLRQLERSFTPHSVTTSVEVPDVNFGVDVAIPCGLLISELVCNAFKYAFPNQREGVIRITLAKDGDGDCLLSISDNGVGLPEDVDVLSSNSLGFQLVHTLVDQLDGRLAIERRGGTTFRIAFKNRE